MDEKRKIDPVPENFASIAEAAEFWDTHDTADYWDDMHDVEVEYLLPPRKRVSVTSELASQLERVAKQQGVSFETLVNVWLQEKLGQFLQPVIAT